MVNLDKKDAVSGMRVVFVLFVLYLISWAIAYFFPHLVSATSLRNQFFVVYSTFSGAADNMKHDDFDLDVNAYGGKKDFVRSFAHYFDVKDLCISNDFGLCLEQGKDVYETLVGDPSVLNYDALNAGQFVLSNDTLIMMHNTSDDLWIYADVNGVKIKPNRFGVDVFVFTINKLTKEFRVLGEPGTLYQNLNKYCNPYTSGLKYNGFSCSFAAALKSDYFENTLEALKLK